MYLLRKQSKDWKKILSGKYDHLPEDAFRLVGRIEEVVKKAEELEQ